MALFKVKINCVYLDLFPKTNIPKKIYKAGEFLELENINVGDQPERLVEATEEEILQYKAGKKTVPVPVVTSAPGNDDKPTESAQGNIDTASKEASKAKLLGDSAAPIDAPTQGNDKPIENAGNVDVASKEASKAKLLGDSAAPIENAGKGSKK